MTPCPYCGQPATRTTDALRLPACEACVDTVAREDENAIDAALSADGRKEAANDGNHRDVEIDAEAAAEREMAGCPPSLEGWLLW